MLLAPVGDPHLDSSPPPFGPRARQRGAGVLRGGVAAGAAAAASARGLLRRGGLGEMTWLGRAAGGILTA
ncbi:MULTISPECIES: hypothetical protein [Streptomyces]|uniref:Uncharacterized protein n=2 Tax=Streptomyces TaxID=1883 RepID=A0A100Y0T7_9ACTN|nr:MULTISPECIES: hypothetical protein [Streptomyces]KUH35611.1 hypothetical protein ATE80_28220 [Streptomyces kanasensis]UUS32384.1 hypothetical protein NRO40_17250 [Streptomyces changanensis]